MAMTNDIVHKKSQNAVAIGSVFGMLTVESLCPERRNGKPLWRCLCACGNYHRAASATLRRGSVKSCGCLRRRVIAERSKTHGMTHTPEHHAWASIKQRCFDPNVKSYRHYGGRGITMCERWRSSFEAFYLDMGPRPSNKHSIDRIDNDGNYEPGNCRWATRGDQSRNKRTNRLLTHAGKTLTVMDWAAETGFGYWVIYERIANLGWTTERTLTTPVKPYNTKRRRASNG